MIFLANNTEVQLDQYIWADLPQGMFQISFFANDSVGHINNTYVYTLYKDLYAPNVTLNWPNNETYWNVAPSINLTIYELYLDTVWYNVTGNATQIIISNPNNTLNALDQYIWADLAEGMFQISIYANDSFGHINNSIILTLYKDTLAPEITVNLPLNETYIGVAPTINVTYTDMYNESLWYTVTGNSTQIFLANNTDVQLDQYIWAGLADGAFQIFIFANDSAGNINNTYSITLYKDTGAPVLTIISPTDNGAHATAPLIHVTAVDMNLSAIWYVCNGVNVTISNNTQVALNNSIWIGLGEGNFTIAFYANDTSGHLNDLYNYSLIKDTQDPFVEIQTVTIGDVKDILNVADVLVKWVVIEATTDVEYVQIRIDSGDWILLDASLTTYTFLDVSLGTHEIDVRAVDSAGNAGIDNYPITIDFQGVDPSIEYLLYIVFIGGIVGIVGMVIIFIKRSKTVIARAAS